MNKIFLLIFTGVIVAVFFGFLNNVVYFPSDLKNLFPAYSSESAKIPRNTLVSDPFMQFEPWRAFAKSELKKGRFPLWNGLNANGIPLFANILKQQHTDFIGA